MAIQVISVTPVNVEPDGGEHNVPFIPEASDAVTAKLKLTDCPLTGFVVRLSGHTIVGGWLSVTLTLKLHDLVKLPLSIAVHVTIVLPSGNHVPEGLEQD